jgi:hypothetical protein
VKWVVLPEADPLKRSRGSKQPHEKSGKDGYTVKKLIALLLAVVFVSTSIVGCGGETKSTTGGGAKTGTGGGAPPGGGTGDKKP